MAHADVIIKNLSKAYGSNKVLENISVTFPAREISCVMAPSGKGKTTLFKIIMGLEKADSGEVIIPKDSTLAAVFQEDRLCENLTAEANIVIATSARKEKIAGALCEIGLNGFEKAAVSTLSGGMKRRVAILRALLSSADIILMDEPFKGLDEDTKHNVMQLVKRYTKEKTVIIVTHIESEATNLGASFFFEL